MKFSVLSLLLVLASFLAACAGGGSKTVQPADVSAYSTRMHARFYKAWVPPESVGVRRAKISVPVEAAIDARGRVIDFQIVKSSGNAAIDESVRAVSRKVQRVARPPRTETDEPFKLRINFVLDVE